LRTIERFQKIPFVAPYRLASEVQPLIVADVSRVRSIGALKVCSSPLACLRPTLLMERIAQGADDTLSEHGEALPGSLYRRCPLTNDLLEGRASAQAFGRKLTGIQRAIGAVLGEKSTSCEQARIFWLVVEPI
jgi:hypothetical protein